MATHQNTQRGNLVQPTFSDNDISESIGEPHSQKSRNANQPCKDQPSQSSLFTDTGVSSGVYSQTSVSGDYIPMKEIKGERRTPTGRLTDDEEEEGMAYGGAAGDSPRRDDDRHSTQPLLENDNAPPNLETDALEIVVYMADKNGISMRMEDGQHTTAGEIFDYMIDENELFDDAKQLFSLWLVSDLLELQLKPTHIPFLLVCYWEELLLKYTSCTEKDLEKDEALLMFKRNVFYPRSKETQIKDHEVLNLLYNEAKNRMLYGFYPLSQEDCDYLAGIQMLLTYKDLPPHVELLKEKLVEFYPTRLCKRKWSLPFTRNEKKPEERLLDSYARAREKIGPITNEDDVVKAVLCYLEFCWKLPYYGSVFFRAQIESPSSKFSLTANPDSPVNVAINMDGVCVIDLDKEELLLAVFYEELQWEYSEPEDKENPDCLPCLLLQFPAPDGNRGISKMLQVFSKQAVLMDTLIDTCVKIKLAKKKPEVITQATDEVDGARAASPASMYDCRSMINRNSLVGNMQKLCLATFDHEGNCIDTTIKGMKKRASVSA